MDGPVACVCIVDACNRVNVHVIPPDVRVPIVTISAAIDSLALAACRACLSMHDAVEIMQRTWDACRRLGHGMPLRMHSHPMAILSDASSIYSSCALSMLCADSHDDKEYAALVRDVYGIDVPLKCTRCGSSSGSRAITMSPCVPSKQRCGIRRIQCREPVAACIICGDYVCITRGDYVCITRGDYVAEGR
jgi:hypothetical protein